MWQFSHLSSALFENRASSKFQILSNPTGNIWIKTNKISIHFVFFFPHWNDFKVIEWGSSELQAMAQGLIQTGTNHSFFFLSSKSKIAISFILPSFHLRVLPLPRCFCSYSSLQQPIDLCNYRETFSKRMDMAGLKPHHRIGQLPFCGSIICNLFLLPFCFTTHNLATWVPNTTRFSPKVTKNWSGKW